jgi:hypothetical protein
VRAILLNARYTGREVWNRQRREESLLDVNDVSLGNTTKMRWNDRAAWVWSAKETHEQLVTAEDYARVQEHLGAGANRPATRQPRRTPRPYALRGILFCGACGRRMQGNWNHGKAHYRCRFASEYAGLRDDAHQATIYVREDEIVPRLDDWLAQLFDPDRVDETVEQLLEAGGPTDEDAARRDDAQRRLDDCDARLAKYRTALENGADATVVATWIAEVQGERLCALRALNDAPDALATADEMRALSVSWAL